MYSLHLLLCDRIIFNLVGKTNLQKSVTYVQIITCAQEYSRLIQLHCQIYGIDGTYVDGVSITRGYPRQHIWTFMAALQENSFNNNGYYVYLIVQ